MLYEALLHVEAECPWVSQLRKRGSEIRIVSCRPAFKGSVASAFITLNTRSDAETLRRQVESIPMVVEASFRKTSRNTAIGVVESIGCPCLRLGLSSNHVLRIGVAERGLMFRVLVPDLGKLREIESELYRSGIRFRVEKIRRLSTRQLLTPRQEQVLIHAYLRGFFNYPRPTSVTKMARDFGIKTSTYTELLRRALAKLATQWVS